MQEVQVVDQLPQVHSHAASVPVIQQAPSAPVQLPPYTSGQEITSGNSWSENNVSVQLAAFKEHTELCGTASTIRQIEIFFLIQFDI